MTADHGNEPDLDLLAEYAAGLLEGTPEGAAVAERVATDPAWRELHAALVHADEAVRADLAGLPPVAMPADVAARLDRAVAAEAGAGSFAGAAAARANGAAEHRAAEQRAAEDGAAEHRAGKAVVALRRRNRWMVAVGSVAAGVAVLAAGAIGLQTLTSSSQDRSTSSAGSAQEAGEARTLASGSPPPAAAPSATAPPAAKPTGRVPAPAQGPDDALGTTSVPRRTASGTDYRDAALDTQVQALLNRVTATLTDPTRDFDAESTPVPTELQRLTSPTALQACLGALQALGQPRALDYARFDGAPSLIIVLPAGPPTEVDVAVVGPVCGQSGSDLRHRATVPAKG